MKYKVYFLTAILAVLFASCSEDFLTRYPSGGTILQDQYDELDNTVSGTMRGIYYMLYTYSDHDQFGQRSIDMYGDILCGDMALTASNYGWFRTDEQMQTYSARRAYLWSYYYDIIHNTNAVINLIKTQSDLVDKVGEYGFPTDSLYEFSAEQTEMAGYYAQALTMRGYAYAGLLRFFCPTIDQMSNGIDNELAVPVYTELNMDTPRPRSTAAEVYNRIEQDLSYAVEYFSSFGATRGTNKIEVDINIARTLLAYAYLNKGDYENALIRAKEVIDAGAYRILPNDMLLTTGFANISEESWMWGKDVTVENATGLGSFFGQVDIHSYSYAWAGDKKALDENLHNSIPAWDGRSRWFDKDGCPSRKFFSPDSKNTTDADSIDRDWLSDDVFMRIESVYLIAAEAALKQTTPDLTAAYDYLTAITDQRIDTTATAAAEYATYKATLTTSAALEEALIYNWRLEMWGEGYGLQTFRRLTHVMTRGGNHLYGAGTEYNHSQGYFTFEMPSSETIYNPYIGTELE